MKVKYFPSLIQFTEISGKIKHDFIKSGKNILIRIIGTKYGTYDRFNCIKIGDKEIARYENYLISDTNHGDNKINIRDIPMQFNFKKGESITIEHDDCIDSLILFFN